MAFTISAGPQSGSLNSVSSISSTLFGVNAGDLILIEAAGIRFSAPPPNLVSITISGEANATPVFLWTVGQQTQVIGYLLEATATGNPLVTVTFDAVCSSILLRMMAVTPDSFDVQFDGYNVATGSSSTASVNVTTLQDEAMLFGFTFAAGWPITPGAGYTEIEPGDPPFDSTFQQRKGLYDLDAGVAGVKTMDFTQSNTLWHIGVTAFSHSTTTALIDYIPNGGVELGGAADISSVTGVSESYTGAGGVEVYGTATVEFNGPVDFSYTGDGGLTAGGSAVELGSSFTAQFVLPSLATSGEILAGRSFHAVFSLPAVSLSSELFPGTVLEAAFSLPAPHLESRLLPGRIFLAEFALPSSSLTSILRPGQILLAAPSLPPVTLDSTLFSQSNFTARFQLPSLQLSAALQAAIAEVFRTWVLNTRKAALTEYDFQFNSYAFFNGQVLAASPSGVVALGTQSKDNAANITARVRVASTDYGVSVLKRVPRIYTGMKADGDLLFRTIVTGAIPRTYRLPNNHVVGFQQRRVPVGKGPKSRYWQFEWENEKGADFSLQNLLVYPTALRRRVM